MSVLQSSAPITLEAWIRRLGEEEFPMFAHTARSIAAISANDATPTNELAQIVLRDSAMTARLLRMANSAFYNPGSIRISTVSRAIVLLGFLAVRNIALSISLVETLLPGSRNEYARAELVRSFHAAVQAKEFAEELQLPNKEELFIAALLYRIGAVAFWCFPYGKDEVLQWQYHNTSSPEQAERKVLGFTLRELTVALTRDWQLSPLLAAAMTSHDNRDRSLKIVENSYRLADAVSKGWDHPETGKVMASIAQATKQTQEWVTRLVFQNAQKAARLMEGFGVPDTSRYIPTIPSEVAPAAVPPDPPLLLQLSILRELAALLAERADLNVVLGAVLEGIYRALKMDRVVFAVVDARHAQLNARFVLGKDRERWQQQFRFSLTARENIFTRVMSQNEAQYVDKRSRILLENLLVPELKALAGINEFMLAPVGIQGQVRGIIYADRVAGSTPVAEQDFLAFRHFCEHANIAFQLLTTEGKRL